MLQSRKFKNATIKDKEKEKENRSTSNATIVSKSKSLPLPTLPLINKNSITNSRHSSNTSDSSIENFHTHGFNKTNSDNSILENTIIGGLSNTSNGASHCGSVVEGKVSKWSISKFQNFWIKRRKENAFPILKRKNMSNPKICDVKRQFVASITV